MSSAQQIALEKLAQQIASCRACPLCEAATQAVPGEGNPNADVLCIGEGPGKDEDIQGRPFVGRAGKLLTEMIESIGWHREDVFIANVVKHRPPNNRDPEPAEVEACWGFLTKQIEIIQPRLIVTLGRHSMNRFFPDLKIGEAHGQLMQDETGQAFLPLYHPAAALYSPSQKELHVTDFAKIPAILKKLPQT